MLTNETTEMTNNRQKARFPILSFVRMSLPPFEIGLDKITLHHLLFLIIYALQLFLSSIVAQN